MLMYLHNFIHSLISQLLHQELWLSKIYIRDIWDGGRDCNESQSARQSLAASSSLLCPTVCCPLLPLSPALPRQGGVYGLHAADDGLHGGAPGLVVELVHLIDEEQPHELHQRLVVAPLSCHAVPLFLKNKYN